MRLRTPICREVNGGGPRKTCAASIPHACNHPQRYLVAIGCALALIFGGILSTVAQAQSLEEHEAKAAFVLKLVNFVQWPAEHNNKLAVCIIGADATADVLQRMASGKSVNDKAIVVQRLRPESDLKACQLVYIGASESKKIPALLERLRGASVLTVGESDGFGQHGGIVRLLINQGRIHFEVNPHAAERAHLQISSRLLSLATIVSDGS